MREIPLSKGYIAYVDNDDYKLVRKYAWHTMIEPCGNRYAAHVFGRGGPRVLMHNMIMNPKWGFEIDHIDGNGCNNQRANMRQCTHRQNTCNVRKRLGTSSRFKGVAWDITRDKWQAYVSGPNGRKALGRFNSEVEAALAYDAAAKESYGEFARLNFPLEAVLV